MVVVEKPWYRHFWVWFVLTPLIGTVLASIVTLFLAGAPPALVVDDYGPIAMTVERDLQRDRRAAELGVTARLQIDPRSGSAGQAVAVRLAGAAPRSLTLELIHPTLEGLDQRLELTRRGDTYTGTMPRADTRLYVLITDAAGDWRLSGELARGSTAVDLAPGR